jgi:hypothetical protein
MVMLPWIAVALGGSDINGHQSVRWEVLRFVRKGGLSQCLGEGSYLW